MAKQGGGETVLDEEDFAEIWARVRLYEINKEASAYDIKTIPKTFTFVSIFLYAIFLVFTGYWGLIVSLNLFSFSYFLYRLVLFLLALPHSKPRVYTSGVELPTYCILLPVRNEHPDIIQLLIHSIHNLEYDKSKLDVILLVDKDDKYLKEIKELPKPSYFRIISADAREPFTKPKACNVALMQTSAEYITIYDAEDSPNKGQLLEVLGKFKEDDDIQCVQSELRFNTPNGNFLSALFSLEYLIWFSLMIKGLSRVQGKDGFIPLGGTSQHFRTDFLKSIGGWDAYNVTEDCELGIRIIRNRGKIKTISNHTDEVAVTELPSWVKQRTRWNLGYMITFLVHTQNVGKLIKDIGWTRFIHFVINVGLSIVHTLITPILLTMFVVSFFYHHSTFIDVLPKITFIGNYVIAVFCAVYTVFKAREYHRLFLCLVFPFYYILHPIAAWRAVYKLFTNPHGWEKTKKIAPIPPWWSEHWRS